MKKTFETIAAYIFTVVAVLAVSMLIHSATVKAQSYGALGISSIAPTVAQCPAGASNVASICPVGSATAGYALYVSYNGATYQPLVPVVSGVVLSFNGRTGAVVSAQGDYGCGQVTNCTPNGVTSFNTRSGAVTLGKADVIATGLGVTTTVTSTGTSALQ